MRANFHTDRNSATNPRIAGAQPRGAKRQRRAAFLASTAVATALGLGLAGGAAMAQTLEWDPSATAGVQGGAGNWDTTTSNWTADAGSSNTTYAINPTVQFGGSAAGTVTITTPVTAADIVLNANSTSGYVIDGAGQTLTLSDAGTDNSGTISITTPTGTASLNVATTDASGMAVTVVGPGTLSLGTALTADTVDLTGNTTIASGGSITTVGSPAAVDDLDVQSGTLTNNGSITSTVQVDSGAIMTSTGSVSGNIQNNGTLNIAGTGTNGVTGTVTNNNVMDITGALDVSGVLTQRSTTALTVDAATSVGSLGITAGTVTVATSNTLTTSSGASIIGNSGRLNVNGALVGNVSMSDGAMSNTGTITGNVTSSTAAASSITSTGLITGNLTVANNTAVSLAGTSATSTGVDGDVSIGGNSSLNITGALDVTGTLGVSTNQGVVVDFNTSAQNVIITNGATVSLNGGNLTSTNAISVSGALNNVNGDTIVGDVNVNATTGSFSSNGDVTGAVTSAATSALSGTVGSLSVTGGTTTVASAGLASDGSVSQTGGTVVLDGNLTAGTGGTGGTSGTSANLTTLTANGAGARSLTVQTADATGSATLNGTTTINSTSLDVTADTINLGSSFAQAGTGALTFAATTVNSAASAFNIGGSFDYDLNVTGGTTTVTAASDANLDNTGTTAVAVSGGTLAVNNDLTDIDTFTLSGNGALTVATGATLQSDTFTLGSSTAATIAGTLQGTGNTINNDMTVNIAAGGTVTDSTGGIFNDTAAAGVGIFNFTGANGTLSTTGATTNNITNQNAGQINVQAGSSGAVISSAGALINQGSAIINIDDTATISAVTSITNSSSAGIVIDSAGVNISTAAGGFANTGVLNVGGTNAAGATISLTGGDFTNGVGGNIDVGAGAASTLAITTAGAANIVNAGGALDVAAGSTLTLNAGGTINVTGGTITNGGTVSATGETMNVSNSGAVDHNGTNFTVGTLALSGSGDVNMGGNASITTLTLNGGTFDVDAAAADVNVTNAITNNGSAAAITAGQLLIGGGTGSFTNTSGSLAISGGGQLNGTLTNNAVFDLAGTGANGTSTGAVTGAVVNAGDMDVTAAASLASTLTNQGSGNIDLTNNGIGGGNLTVANAYTHNGGSVTFGNNTLSANAVTINSALTIDDTAGGASGTLTSTGTVTVNNAAGTDLTVASGATLNATGQILDVNSGAAVTTAGSVTSAQLTNDGTFTMTAGTSNVGALTNATTGIVEHTGASGTLTIASHTGIQLGTIRNLGNGTIAVGAGFANMGTLVNGDAVGDTGAFTVSGTVVNRGFGTVTQAGGGTMTTTGLTNDGNAANVFGPAAVTVSAGVLDVNGAVTNTSGLISVTGGDLQATSFANNGAASANAVTQLNGGTITMTAANALTNTTGTMNFNGGQVVGNVSNADQVNVQAGSGAVGTVDVTGNYSQSAGDTNLQGNFDVGDNVSITGGTVTFGSAGNTFSGGNLTTETFGISGTAALDFSSFAGTVDAAGALSYSSSANLDVTSGSTLEGNTVTLSGTGTMLNSGTIRSTADTNPNDINLTTTLTSTGLIDGFFTNNGTLFIQGTGASAGVQGNFTNASTTTLTGDLGVTGTFAQNAGTVDFNGTTNAAGYTLTAATADINAALNVNGGRLAATNTELAGVTLTISDDTTAGSASLGGLTLQAAGATVSNTTAAGTVAIASVTDGTTAGTNQGTIQNIGNGAITVAAAISNNTGTLTNGDATTDTGNFTVTGGVTNAGGTVTQTSTGTFNAGGVLANSAGGTVDVNGGTLQATTVNNAATLTVNGGTLLAAVNNNSGGTLTLDSSAANGGGYISGNVVNNGGFANLQGHDVANADGTIAGAQGINGNLTNQAGGSITLTGDLEVSGLFTQGATGGGGGPVTFSGNRLTANGVTVDATLAVAGNGILESTGAVQINNGAGIDLTVAGGSTLLATGQTVTVASGATVNHAGRLAASVLNTNGNFTNTGTVGADESSVITPLTTLTNTGTFDNASGGTVYATTVNNNAGTFNQGTGSQIGSATNAVTTFNNSALFNANGGDIYAGTFNNLAGGTFDLLNNTTFVGNFNNAAGTFSDGGAFALTVNNGDFTNGTTMLLDNGGDITVAGGTSGGTFDNNGTLQARGTGSVITVANQFSNQGGTIDLRDGAADDQLTIAGAVTGNGTFGFDVDLTGAGATDVLSLGSYTGTLTFAQNVLATATGNVVDLALITGDTSGLSFGGSSIVATDGATNTYLLRNDGAGGVRIVTDTGGTLAVAGNISLVQSLISTVVNRPSSPFVSGLAYDDEDNCGTGSWARFTGGSASATANTFNGVSNLPSTVDATFYGLTGGIDYGCFDAGGGAYDIAGGMILGYNAGTTKQDVFATNFTTTPPSIGAYQSTTEAKFSQSYVGGYIALAKDAWSADVQLRFENADFEFSNASIGLYDEKTSSQSTTLSSSISYSFPLNDSVVLVPTAGFGITKAKTDDLVFRDNTGTETGRLSFDDHTTRIGFVGATVAKTVIGASGDSATNRFVTATYYSDFSDDQTATFTASPGGATLPVSTEALGSFGELSVGLSYIKILDGQVGKAKQLNASVRADARFSEDVEALSLTAQVRFQF